MSWWSRGEGGCRPRTCLEIIGGGGILLFLKNRMSFVDFFLFRPWPNDSLTPPPPPAAAMPLLYLLLCFSLTIMGVWRFALQHSFNLAYFWRQTNIKISWDPGNLGFLILARRCCPLPRKKNLPPFTQTWPLSWLILSNNCYKQKRFGLLGHISQL